MQLKALFLCTLDLEHVKVFASEQYCACAKVPCSHVVKTAKASVESNPEGATAALKRFAAVSENDAETGAHRIFRECSLTAPIPVQFAQISEDVDQELASWPVLKFSDWLLYLLESGRLPSQLCGVPHMDNMRERLTEFWARWKALHPTHQVFSRAQDGLLDLSLTVPIWSHSDEGRSQKQKPILVLSVHGCVGRGTLGYLKAVEEDESKRAGMGLNFIGATWSNQFLYSVMLREVYSQKPELFQGLAGTFADDLRKCWEIGVATENNPELRVWAVHLGTKGDLPALTKIGRFEDRSYSRVPKTGQSKTLCRGICHLCHAAQETPEVVVWEDLREDPEWASTMHQTVPWPSEPPILRGALLVPEEVGDFFKLDIWHNFHMGVAKVWLASSFMVLCNINVIAGNSIIAQFEALTELYRGFCYDKRLAMHMQQFSRDTMGIDSNTSFPTGKWNKGAASTNLMLFLQFLCEKRIVGQTHDPLLLTIAARLSQTFFVYSNYIKCMQGMHGGWFQINS